MIKKIKKRDGILLVIFIVALVMSSMVITTAFYDLVRLINIERTNRTQEKIRYVMRGIASDPFLIGNEGGMDLDYVNQERAIPTTIAQIVNNDYLQHVGLESANYQQEHDAFGRDLDLRSVGNVTTIYSWGVNGTDDSAGGDDIAEISFGQDGVKGGGDDIPASINELEHASMSFGILFEDLDTSVTLDNNFFAVPTIVAVIDTTTVVSALGWVGPEYNSVPPSGRYELIITQASHPIYTTWMESIYGAGVTELRAPIWAYPNISANLNKRIRFAASID